MIDSHCHVDQYKNPERILRECERLGITVLAMTNLPSHFEIGYKHVLPFKKTRLALGMHPLYADEHEKEFPLFVRNLSRTSYIGEIGLDFSKEGYSTKEIQLNTFRKILDSLASEKKILSLHSRRAEKEVLNNLVAKKIKSAIFHWYSGAIKLIDDISEAGYFFSVNPSMIRSESGRKIIARIPENRILTETDGPFTQLDGRQTEPADVQLVSQYLAVLWGKTIQEIDGTINANFQNLIAHIR
jgi:TatD DNase family protein